MNVLFALDRLAPYIEEPLPAFVLNYVFQERDSFVRLLIRITRDSIEAAPFGQQLTQCSDLLDVQIVCKCDFLAAKRNGAVAVVLLIFDIKVNELRKVQNGLCRGRVALFLGWLLVSVARQHADKIVVDLGAERVVWNRGRDAFEVLYQISLVDPRVVFCKQIFGHQEHVVASEPWQLIFLDLPALGVVVEADLGNADLSTQGWRDVAPRKLLRVVAEKFLDQVRRKVANVVAPTPPLMRQSFSRWLDRVTVSCPKSAKRRCRF